MNRVLSWPHTPVFPGLLSPLMAERHRTVVTRNGMVRLEQPLGPVEMKFSSSEQQLPPGTAVEVWWKGGGFVCMAIAELEAEASLAQAVASQVQQARARLRTARQERLMRDSSFDQLTPEATVAGGSTVDRSMPVVVVGSSLRAVQRL